MPFIEGNLFADNRHPIFAKALTHGQRVVPFDPRILTQEGGLRRVGELIAEFHVRYAKMPTARAFPLAHFALFVEPDRVVRYSVGGDVLGEFIDVPCNPSFKVGGTSYTIE